MLDIALRLKAEMSTALGWGKTTKNAISRVHPKMSVRDLHTNGETAGNGCGPLMRSLPLVLYTAGWSQKKFEHVAYESAVLTHNNPENIACTVTHHQVLGHLLENQSGDGLVEWAHDKAIYNEKLYGARPVLSGALRRVRESADIAGAVYESGKWGAFTSWAVQAGCYAVYERTKAGTLIDLLVEVVSEGGDAEPVWIAPESRSRSAGSGSEVSPCPSYRVTSPGMNERPIASSSRTQVAGGENPGGSDLPRAGPQRGVGVGGYLAGGHGGPHEGLFCEGCRPETPMCLLGQGQSGLATGLLLRTGEPR